MTNEEILKKAIEKIGWKYHPMVLPVTVIFDHDFAKAFWGEEESRCNTCPLPNNEHKFGEVGHPRIDVWRFHLQQMVLEEDPIKYLERFLTK